MLVKAKDDPAPSIATLEALLARPDLPDKARRAIEAELAKLRSGLRGERDVAYYLNFEFRDDPDWAILHDLRLQVDEYTAQIDHLLLNRWLEFYVLESKAFLTGLKVTRDGQYLFWHARYRRYQAIPSPILQVERHAKVLRKLLATEVWPHLRHPLPEPELQPLVLLSPTSRLIIEDGAPDEARRKILLADRFARDLRTYTQKWLHRGKRGRRPLLTQKQLLALARRLLRYHRPKPQPDYYARFRIPRQPRVAESPAPYGSASETAARPRRYFCAKCGTRISPRVAMFCFRHKERFGGRAYCMDCQKDFPPA